MVTRYPSNGRSTVLEREGDYRPESRTGRPLRPDPGEGSARGTKGPPTTPSNRPFPAQGPGRSPGSNPMMPGGAYDPVPEQPLIPGPKPKQEGAALARGLRRPRVTPWDIGTAAVEEWVRREQAQWPDQLMSDSESWVVGNVETHDPRWVQCPGTKTVVCPGSTLYKDILYGGSGSCVSWGLDQPGNTVVGCPTQVESAPGSSPIPTNTLGDEWAFERVLREIAPGAWRATRTKAWRWDSGLTTPDTTVYVGVSRPYPAQSFPDDRPAPWDLPFPAPAKTGDPLTQPQREPEPSHPDTPTREVRIPSLRIPLVLIPFPETRTDVSPKPDEQVIIVPPGDTGTEVITRPSPGPFNQPPNRRQKEKKVRMRGVTAVAWHLIGTITEGVDFIEVLHEALPKPLQAKPKRGAPPTPFAMIEAVYRHFDQLDVAQAVENYVNNQFEDWVYGQLGKGGKHLNQLTGAPTGGGRSLSNPGRNVREFSDKGVEIPQFNWDDETGDWSIDWGDYTLASGTARSW